MTDKRVKIMREVAAILCGVAFLAGLSFGGLYVFRADFYGTVEVELTPIAELYPVSPTAVAITGYDTESGPLLIPRLRNADECTGWRIESGVAEIAQSDGELRIPLRPGDHDYVAKPLGCVLDEPAVDALRFNLFFGEVESFGMQNLSREQYQVNFQNVPMALGKPLPFSRWVPDVEAAFPEEAAQAREALIDAGFDSSASTREKIEFLVAFVRRHMPSAAPPSYLNNLSPWRVFLEGKLKGAGNFCRQWSLVYGYLANLIGIPSRNVFTGGAMDNVDLGSHAFSESYVREQAGWAFVDPTTEIAYVTNAAGRLLSGAELYSAIVTRTSSALTARALVENGYKSVPFAAVGKALKQFMRRNSFLIYIGSHDGRYQMQGSGAARYVQQLYRFLFQPQQYFGFAHFVSFSWIRSAAFFTCIVAAFFAFIFSIAAIVRGSRR